MIPMYKFAGYIIKHVNGDVLGYAPNKPMLDKFIKERGIPVGNNPEISIKIVYTQE